MSPPGSDLCLWQAVKVKPLFKVIFSAKKWNFWMLQTKNKILLEETSKLDVFYSKEWLWSRSLRKWGATQWQFSIKRLFLRPCRQGLLPPPPMKRSGLKRLRMMNETHGDVTKYWKLSKNIKKIELLKNCENLIFLTFWKCSFFNLEHFYFQKSSNKHTLKLTRNVAHG